MLGRGVNLLASRRGTRSTDSAIAVSRQGSYGDQVRVLKFPRRLIRKLETPDLPLEALESIRRLRLYLDELEAACMIRARRLGASPSDIGEALGITRQAVYNRLHSLELRADTNADLVAPDLAETEKIPDLDTPPTRTSDGAVA
jgi:hypothetical protein